MKLTIVGNTGTISAPRKSGEVVSLSVVSDQGDFGPNHGAAWYVMPPVPSGKITGGIVPFGTDTDQLRFTVPLMSGPVRVQVEVYINDVWTGERFSASTHVYLAPVEVEPVAPVEPVAEVEPNIITRRVIFTDIIASVGFTDVVWGWLASVGYINVPEIMGFPWSSTKTKAQVEAKALEYEQPLPPQQLSWLLPARVRSGFKVDTALYLVATKVTTARLTFYPDNIVVDVNLSPFNAWTRNIYADLGLDMVDLITVSGDVYATTLWATATQLIPIEGFKL